MTESARETEEMRHVPPILYLTGKLDTSFRARLTLLCNAMMSELFDETSKRSAEKPLRQVCRWLEQIDELLRTRRPEHRDSDLQVRTLKALNAALESLRGIDISTFRRRQPDHLFERSRGEETYAAFIAAHCALNDLAQTISVSDPDIWSKLYDAESEHA